ncbi:hypothetical protein NX801_11345 [Streptomyces sp. LP05-1]|uniref:Integral membrane protein n=1 Tax=Streptomyces pyxinae TaxID=2970734 RepID=A0ABT2CFR4_9ACTN|nr:hypothetical protein [Streptomyces sp. LP05-1]MCS0636243.1 hypothetical protein [Streptomyces sp. LP05-1]
MGAAVTAVTSESFGVGAQVPIQGSGGGTVATNALASAAYRDGPVEEILKADNDVHKSTVVKGRFSLFEPNLGEAFARAVQARMLGGARAPLIQSFGTEPQPVVEHCLAANRVRRRRDRTLTLITVGFGVVFLPGLLIWLAVFQLRRTLSGASNKGAGALGTAMVLAVGVLAVLFWVRMPFGGLPAIYLRVMFVAPVIGWFLAKRVCEKTAQTLRAHWESLLTGGAVGPKLPEAVPQNPGETAAEELRQSLAKLGAEQRSNVVFYAGPKGILGMGTRWGSWQLAEELVPQEGREIHAFRTWDVIRPIHDELKLLERGTLKTGFPTPVVNHWIVSPVGEGAAAVARPASENVVGFQVKPHEIQRICNENQFGKGDRHYLGVQFVLWDGQLVLTMMVTVTALLHTLRIEVTGHALGPVHPLFTTKPSPKSRTVSKSVRFWETKTIPLPLVETNEVVRLAARAPLTWFPPVLDHLGGKLVLPEPFGLRHAWADQPWRHRFMADDAIRAATPVMRAVHRATIRTLDDHGVDTERFSNRSMVLSGSVQDPSPRRADAYDA